MEWLTRKFGPFLGSFLGHPKTAKKSATPLEIQLDKKLVDQKILATKMLECSAGVRMINHPLSLRDFFENWASAKIIYFRFFPSSFTFSSCTLRHVVGPFSRFTRPPFSTIIFCSTSTKYPPFNVFESLLNASVIVYSGDACFLQLVARGDSAACYRSVHGCQSHHEGEKEQIH